MKIKEVAETLERFAPLPLQESYDNAGLQIGLTEAEDVSGVLLCLDVTEEVIDEAARKGCNLIVAHHPLLFRPLRHVTLATQVERCVVKAVKQGIAIYAAHTNLDNAPGGVNFEIGRLMKLQQMQFLDPRPDGRGGSGVIGTIAEPLEAEAFSTFLSELFHVPALRHNDYAGTISRVAFCGGAGDFLLDEAIARGADAFFTGEMSYHRFFGHEHEIYVAALGHYETEVCTIDLLHRVLHDAHPELRLVKTELCTNPITTTNN